MIMEKGMVIQRKNLEKIRERDIIDLISRNYIREELLISYIALLN